MTLAYLHARNLFCTGTYGGLHFNIEQY
ncbi:hypothetical protein H1P_490022 [Hyella patelloides LEGE 07179]|uniref:Uncharacterized protein n=1 Tax=Hyella patelloides LEGE 07179 TaxID=945734 RepID=A0A563VZ94_9CYAN|nr:hypothetical protein H1P_490022 [Hyella patelloides LEGE 07179]